MPSLKAAVAPAIHGIAWALGLSTLRARSRPVMRILMLHGVGGEDYPADTFVSQMEWLARRFSVVPLHAIVKKAIDGKGAPLNEIALTFDDGLKNQAAIVHPILKRLRLPATFFLCPGLIETGRWLWNHEVRARLRTLPAGRIARAFPGADSVEGVVTRMKTLDAPARREAEAAVRDLTPAWAPSTADRERFDVMSWGDVAGLDPALVTIGAHSITHPILPTLDAAEQEEEIAGSRRLLEERLHRTVDLFCYPNGSRDPGVEERVRKHYRAAVTTQPGFVVQGDDTITLPRIATAASTPLLAWRLSRPSA